MTKQERDHLLEQWMDRHGSAVLGAARRILRDDAAARDVVQDSFVKAYLRAGSFRDADHVRAFLLRVAVNDCRSRLRSPWSRRMPLPELLPDPDPPDEEGLALREAMARLPAADREILWLHHLAGYTTAEVARTLNVSPEAARKRLSRSRNRLRVLLEGGYPHEPSL